MNNMIHLVIYDQGGHDTPEIRSAWYDRGAANREMERLEKAEQNTPNDGWFNVKAVSISDASSSDGSAK
jgi:hypothetical protein